MISKELQFPFWIPHEIAITAVSFLARRKAIAMVNETPIWEFLLPQREDDPFGYAFFSNQIVALHFIELKFRA